MTTPTPNGRLIAGEDGFDLVFSRTLPGSIHDAWASVTEPERTARWIGRWEGSGGPGETIRLRLGFEDDAPSIGVRVTECDAPRKLRVQTTSDENSWDLSVTLSGAGDRTEITLVMHQPDPAEVGSVGPGWEYYLDQLVSSVNGTPLPSWEDYFPAQKEHFEKQVS
jgi:uncharacterized protein YndB with AHSA1/START domain